MLKEFLDADSADRIVKPSEDDYQELALEQLMNGLVRTKLGIDADWGRQSARVFAALRGDFMKPVTNGGMTLSVYKVSNIHNIYISFQLKFF